MAAEHLKHAQATLVETIALDGYDDVFSDFDYGPFETRRLSQDLLNELSGRLHRKSGDISLVFEMPGKLRKHEVEAMVKTRLHQVFVDRWKSAGTDIDANQRTAVLRLGAGTAILAGEAVLLVFGKGEFWLTLAGTLISPAGWFGVFTGLERLFDLPKLMIKKRNLYGRLKDAEVSFVSLK